MADAPQGLDTQPIDLPPPKGKVQITHIKPVGVGVEYGHKLESICKLFEEIRGNGFYAADENRQTPRFSESIVLHGFGGTYKVESLGRDVVKREDGSEISFPKQKFTFIPPDTDIIHEISNLGILSSDIEFEGKPSVREGTEEETTGCADFNMQSRPFESISDFLPSLPKGTFADFVTKPDESEASAVVMFAFDTSRPELAPLMQYAMKDTDPSEKLWPNHLVPGQDSRIDFPSPGSGSHLAVPVGLPANYIEYIVVNEKSPYWQGEKLDQLRQAAVVDGHPIPLVSIHTNTVI